MEERRETFEVLSVRLYNAAIEGDVTSLHELLHSDAHILDRCCIVGRFAQSPLHVAANHGHLEFVKALLAVSPDMCFARDQDGRNPVHVAAMRGQLGVLVELLQVEPQAAKEVTNRNETILHLCVKHRQLKALQHLIEVMDDGEPLRSKDLAGNTILHLAVASSQIEMIKIILEDKRMDKNAINANGSTALDICKNIIKKNSNGKEDIKCICKNIIKKNSNGKEDIKGTLTNAKVLPATTALTRQKNVGTWSENQRDTLMVVASLIATMAFQVATNPIGGVWQDDKPGKHAPTMAFQVAPSPIGGVWQDDEHGHAAGFAVMATKHPSFHNATLFANSIALISSLSVILLLISGFRYKHQFVSLLMITMWIAISATAFTCVFSMYILTYDTPDDHALKYPVISMLAWIALMAILFVRHAIKFILKLIKGMPMYTVEAIRTMCRPKSKTTGQPTNV